MVPMDGLEPVPQWPFSPFSGPTPPLPNFAGARAKLPTPVGTQSLKDFNPLPLVGENNSLAFPSPRYASAIHTQLDDIRLVILYRIALLALRGVIFEVPCLSRLVCDLVGLVHRAFNCVVAI